MTPLYILVSGETQRHENKQAYGDKFGIVIPIPVKNAIQKQNRLNLQCSWEASGQGHVQR